MSVLLSPGVAGCPASASPPSGYTTPWRVDPTTGAWWLPKVTRFSGTGGVYTVSGSATAVCTLVIPDQGVAGVVQAWGHCLLSGTVAGDVFDVSLDNSVTGMSKDRVSIPSSTGGYATGHTVGYIGQAAGATSTLRLIVTRNTGSGSVATVADSNFHVIQALFIPN